MILYCFRHEKRQDHSKFNGNNVESSKKKSKVSEPNDRSTEYSTLYVMFDIFHYYCWM